MELLLRNPMFLSNLLNGPCRPSPFCNTGLYPLKVFISRGGGIRLERQSLPVEADQIDIELSEKMTNLYRSLLPAAPPFLAWVVAVKPSRLIVMTIADTCMNPLLLKTCISRLVIWGYGKCQVESVELYLGNEAAPDGFYNLRKMADPICRELVEAYLERRPSWEYSAS